MPHTITCVKCGAQRSNARNKNTTHCNHCRLLENARFCRERIYDCAVPECKHMFAPIGRGDTFCTEHDFGSGVYGTCALCAKEDAELIRPNVPICMGCAREPGVTRRRMLAGLASGQRARRKANNWTEAA